MPVLPNPALKHLLSVLGDSLIFAEIRIRRIPEGYELCHQADAEALPASLRDTSVEELRVLAQFTADGSFRPLKAAPTLQTGWKTTARTDEDLARALEHIYPGAAADWYAVQTGPPPVTDYREFTARQSGMYRITTHLSDAQAAQMIESCCHVGFCLKRRLWTVSGWPTDQADEKSPIPCLEPCPIALEFARKAVRVEQEEKIGVEIAESELDTIRDALEVALSIPDETGRVADFSSPANPRRRRLLLKKVELWLRSANPRRTQEG